MGVEWFGHKFREGHPIEEAGKTPYAELIARQYCARWNIGDVPQHEHRKWLIQKFWPNYTWHDWTERRLRSTCESNFVTWLGPASSGKTSDAAVLAYEWWSEEPMNSAVIVCSTTKDMLRKRIWGQIVWLHQQFPKPFFPEGYAELIDASCMIRWRMGDMKNGMFGMAVQDGPVEEAINNLIGIHTKRIWVILDEMQGVREAIMGAIPNLTKNPESKFLGMGNPTSMQSMLCKYSEPIGGWTSVERAKTPEWEIKSHGYKGKGKCLFFNGLESPAVLDPEWGKKEAPWMINQADIDADMVRVSGNMADPAFMSQTIGWPPDVGVSNTVLDAQIIESFNCYGKAVWTEGYKLGAALDPAFTEGGDRKILRFFRFGITEAEGARRWMIEFLEWLDVPIDVNIKTPIHYQIVHFCKDRCESKGIRPEQFSLDSSGEGGGLQAIFEEEWGPVNGVEFGGRPSDMIAEAGVDGRPPKTARETFDRRSSELNIMVRRFAMSNGLRGLSQESAHQFCNRMTKYTGKYVVESKKEMKKRIGMSPDNADADAIAVDYCRRNGATPAIGITSSASTSRWNDNVRASDNEYSSENYTLEQVYG